MSNKGLTYYRLTSPYEGDITKNCSLDGYEVDSNFFTLEGRDIKSVNVAGTELVITLMNGETISSLNAFADFTKDMSFNFDTTNGILYITRNGVTQTITGFATSYNTGEAVATDGTVKGNGKPSNPIGLSPMYKSGMYRPVKKVIDTTRCEMLPSGCEVMPGDRYITLENISEYGFLYNFDGVRKIACDLAACNSPWRIPTKNDWDDMLNAIEPCDEDKEHASATCNRYFGKFAGKFLKSKDFWKLEGCNDSCTCINYGDSSLCDNTASNVCTTTTCGEYGETKQRPPFFPNRGIDKYGFGVTPAGYTDDGCQFGYFLERAWFWTGTNNQYSNAYTKRFEYDKSTVYQDVISSKYNLSLRLIKDYDGDNYFERENILGMPYSTVLMPSQSKGKAIWTATNIALPNKLYNPVLPNNGCGMTFTKKYFLNEWDGRRWLKNEMSEGESVVIEKAPNGNTCIEYRIVKGDLVNTGNAIYEDILKNITGTLDGLQEQINNEVTRAVAKENQIDLNLNKEIERSTQKDEELEQKISDEAARLDSDILNVNNRVDSTDAKVKEINNTLSAFGEETKEAFEQINNVLTTSINTINAAIEAERVERANKDTELEEKIEQEISDRIKADEDLKALLDSVSDGSEELSKRLDAEIANREAADTVLQQNIDAEVTRAKAAEEVLDEKITSLNETVENLTEDVNNKYDELKSEIETEKSERKANDAELDAKINQEISDRQNTDDKIDGQLHISEGSSFDKDNGVLTLKSKSGENDIEIQFSFNFGTI